MFISKREAKKPEKKSLSKMPKTVPNVGEDDDFSLYDDNDVPVYFLAWKSHTENNHTPLSIKFFTIPV